MISSISCRYVDLISMFRYVSTLTRSQRFVLEEGILFARDPVLKYQKNIENDKELMKVASSMSFSTSLDDYQLLPPPRNFGQTLTKLFKDKVIYPTDRNENGSHARKKLFVRGCSFPDYAEVEIWPQDATEGSSVRYGFPGVKELILEDRMDTLMGAFDNNKNKVRNNNNSVSTKKKDDVTVKENSNVDSEIKLPKKKKKQDNPFVLDIESLGDISTEIRDVEKDAVLFVSAPYCRLCRTIDPLYTRMARVSKEEQNSDLIFAKATTGTGKAMKQLTFTLQIDSVPTFVLFRKGQRYGESIGIAKLPSVKLNRVIEDLKEGKEWDPSILDIDEGGTKTRTKI